MAVEVRPIQPVELYPDISGDYRLMIEGVLPGLGWANPEEVGVPALELVQAGLHGTAVGAFLLNRIDTKVTTGDELLIVRTVGGKNGIGVANTIHRVDPRAHADGYAYEDIWGDAQGQGNPHKGGDKGIIHDNAGRRGLETKWSAFMLLNDVKDPATGYGAYGPGLAYTNLTVAEQRIAHAVEKERLAKQDVHILTTGIGHVATDFVALKVRGVPQRAGVNRLIHYPDHDTIVPHVYLRGGRLYFSGSGVRNPWIYDGSRRLVGVPIAPLEA